MQADEVRDGVGRAYELMQCSSSAGGMRSDELRGGIERTYELMYGCVGSVRCVYELVWWWARAYVCSRQLVRQALKQASPDHSALTTKGNKGPRIGQGWWLITVQCCVAHKGGGVLNGPRHNTAA